MNGSSADNATPIYSRPGEILKSLIRYNTTNPPGNEAPCINYIKGLLDWAGVPNMIVASDPSRPNLVARLPGRGSSPPLLLYGHIDVVTTANQKWRLNPFIGEEMDGYIWGRGALDMKGAVAMMLAAVMRARLENMVPPGDIILAILCDEEARSTYGAEYLVKNQPQLLSLEHRLPVHITPIVKEQVRMTADALPAVFKQTFMQLLVPTLTNSVLDTLGAQVRMFDPVLHNTAAATAIQGGEVYNVVPGQVTVGLDCRLLPGFTPDDIIAELRAAAGSDIDYEISYFNPGTPEPNMGLFGTLCDIIKEFDPEGTPTPMLFPAATDARLFARLGIQTYGFTPLKLPPDIHFEQLFHAADERVPVPALEFGTSAIYELLQRSGG